MLPPVSVIVPTYGRPEYHSRLYAMFASQRYPGATELLIYDDSPRPSAFFRSLWDPRVRYYWGKDRVSIGHKRNYLTSQARGQVIAAFDDDDAYARGYLEAMVSRVVSSGADLVKLSVWDCISAYDGSCWRWDTRVSGGTCYAVSGAAPPKRIINLPVDKDAREAALIGYGFSYVYTRETASRVPFEDINHGEDLAFIRTLGEQGGKIVLVDDRPNLVLHTLHAKSTSRSYPQVMLRGCDVGLDVEDASDLSGGITMKFRAGKTYRIVGMLKNTHTVDETRNRLDAYGIVQEYTDPYDGEGAPQDGYRYIAATVRVSKDVRVPKAAPPPFSIADKSKIIRAVIV